MENTLNCNINYSIDQILVLPNSNSKFEKQVNKIVINCEIQIPGIDETFTLKISNVLPNPNDENNFIKLEDISKEQFINWGLEGKRHMIDSYVNKITQDTNLKNESVGNTPKVIEAPIVLTESDF